MSDVNLWAEWAENSRLSLARSKELLKDSENSYSEAVKRNDEPAIKLWALAMELDREIIKGRKKELEQEEKNAMLSDAFNFREKHKISDQVYVPTLDGF
jgi:hypothetical protein